MLSKKPPLSIHELRTYFYYNPSNGLLYWYPRNLNEFKSIQHGKTWNARNGHKPAGNSATPTGHKRCTLFKVCYFTHRIVWALYYGVWPDGEIDHINHNASDNRIENLRLVTSKQNQQNRSIANNNSSGFMGVDYVTRHKKWRARIYANEQRLNLGLFHTKLEAIEARKSALVKFGFHPNHGLKVA